MTKESIKAISLKGIDLISLLPKGAIKEISETTGLDRNSVRMILLGVWSNEKVMDCAQEILERQQAQIEVALQVFKE